jgi:hypothetical protein
MYLAAIAGIQISMNFNTSVFPSAVNPISEHFGVSTQKARVGQMIYLVAYSFGCELWAPWSKNIPPPLRVLLPLLWRKLPITKICC